MFLNVSDISTSIFFSDLFDDAFLTEMQKQAKDHELLLKSYHLKLLETQQVVVVQPWYHNSHYLWKHDTTKELMMEETLGLVRTIGWTIVDGLTITIRHNDKNHFLGMYRVLNFKVQFLEALYNSLRNEVEMNFDKKSHHSIFTHFCYFFVSRFGSA